jgi:enhancer of polycomb-like protein
MASSIAQQRSYRNRPIEVTQQLAIVRDPNAINEDQIVSREVSHAHKQLDKENEEVLTKENEKTKQQEIPIPEVLKVGTRYEKDYKADYEQDERYLRSRVTAGRPELETPTAADGVEYDLDNDDEDWLKEYNNSNKGSKDEKGKKSNNDDANNNSSKKEHVPLDEDDFEKMLWKLELACGEANERVLAVTAQQAQEKGSALSYQDRCAALASTSNLPKDSAVEVLAEIVNKQAVIVAVYEYWVEKRKRTQKPCLRRLQPPPAPNDTNPFNVFRPREKIHRPQTRRRRENDVAGYEKLQRARDSLVVARAALQLTLRREIRKHEIFEVERAAQKLLIDLRHEPKSEMERIEKEAKVEDEERAKKELPELPVKGKNVSLCDGKLEIFKANDNNWAIVTEPDESEIIAANKREKQALLNKNKRSRQQQKEAAEDAKKSKAGKEMVYEPPPEIPDIEMLFAKVPLGSALRGFQLPLGQLKDRCKARVGRCGRVIFDRKDPISREAYYCEEDDEDSLDLNNNGSSDDWYANFDPYAFLY